MHFYPEERLAIFIDGVYLHSLSKTLNFDVDFRRVLEFFRSQCTLIRATYYTVTPKTDEHTAVRPLADWLSYNGFGVRTRVAKEYVDDTGRPRIKGHMHGEMIVDALEMAVNVDHILLVAGDGIFRPCAEAIQRRGVRVSVLSTLKTQPPMIADDLRRQADQFVEIGSIVDAIVRTEPRRERAA